MIFVKNSPKSAEKFVNEILKDEIAIKLSMNYLECENNYDINNISSSIQRMNESFVSYADNNTNSKAQKLERLKMQYKIENMKLFREALTNFAKVVQMELLLSNLKVDQSRSSMFTEENSII